MAKTKKTKSSALMRLIGNKNTVTILGLLACVATLVVGYNYRVNKSIDPIEVPYAKQEIPSRTLITSDMIGKLKVARTYTSTASNLVTDVKNVVNHYVSYKTGVPKGSLFYSDSLKDADEMPDSAFANIEDGYTIYSLDVSVEDTIYNSVREGDYIDLAMEAYDKENGNRVIYAIIIQSIRVLAVKDDKGNNIVKSTLVYGKPSELLFAVDDEMFKLLKAAERIPEGNVKITPVLRNHNYTLDAADTAYKSKQLVEFIKRQVETIR